MTTLSLQDPAFLGSGGDPLFSLVSVLLHCDGANNSTQITDSSPNPKTVTAAGDAKLITAQSKFGVSSLNFDGTGDSASAATSADFNLSTGDWTIEYQLRQGGLASSNCVHINLFTSSADKIVLAYIKSNGKLYYLLNGTPQITGRTITADTWEHIALCKLQNTTTLYMGGTSAGTTTAVPTSSAKQLVLGMDNGTSYHNGQLDEIRITRAARYASNFTPPSAPFPDS